MYAHLNTDPPAPSSVRPDLPKALDAVVLKGLAKEPDDRYASAGEFAAAARKALMESGVAPAPEVRTPVAPPTTVTPLPFTPQTVGFSNPGPSQTYGQTPAATSGYGPPSNPGAPTGYGQPSNPGAPTGYGQPTGGYGPPSGPGAPHAFGPPSNPAMPVYAAPGGPPPFGPTIGGSSSSGGGGKSSKLPIILGIAALLVAIIVVVIVLVTNSGDGGGGTDPSAGQTTTPPTSSQPSTPPTTSTTTEAPDPEAQLLAIIPGGWDRDNCRTQDAAGDGDIAALDCGAALAADGPTDSAFYLYPDADTLDGVFLDDTERFGLSELPGDVHCPDQQGFEGYSSNGEHAGRLGCYVREDDNASVLFWTQDNLSAEAYVVIENGGQEGLQTLVDWWQDPSNSDFG
jgi:serine/threonine-protein kinase